MKKHYYWEIIGIIIGMALIWSGIDDELHHRVGVGYNSKGMRTVWTGGFTALIGLLTIISSIASIRGKLK